jgi:hypothetical protein
MGTQMNGIGGGMGMGFGMGFGIQSSLASSSMKPGGFGFKGLQSQIGATLGMGGAMVGATQGIGGMVGATQGMGAGNIGATMNKQSFQVSQMRPFGQNIG